MSQVAPRFALNHMLAPQFNVAEFFELAKKLGTTAVEIRNDISGNAILDGTPPTTISEQASAHGLMVISINALQRFNQWTSEREAEAIALASYAKACGAEALVLVPVNDAAREADELRHSELLKSLRALKPILNEHGIIGLVECLGFENCSLRSKREAVEAIHAVEGADTFRIVHDTFHHHLAGEPELFPQMTGLVHISGVSDPETVASAMQGTHHPMLDSHRTLIDAKDRLGNIEQMGSLMKGGYSGFFSFEPFAAQVHALTDPALAVEECMAFVCEQLEHTQANRVA